METVRKKLTVQEKAFLSDLWQDKDRLHALVTVLSHKQLELAQFALASSPDFKDVLVKRGGAQNCEWIVKFLKYNFDEGEKARKQAEAKQPE